VHFVISPTVTRDKRKNKAKQDKSRQNKTKAINKTKANNSPLICTSISYYIITYDWMHLGKNSYLYLPLIIGVALFCLSRGTVRTLQCLFYHVNVCSVVTRFAIFMGILYYSMYILYYLCNFILFYVFIYIILCNF
jgi:hypothetical protein